MREPAWFLDGMFVLIMQSCFACLVSVSGFGWCVVQCGTGWMDVCTYQWGAGGRKDGGGMGRLGGGGMCVDRSDARCWKRDA